MLARLVAAIALAGVLLCTNPATYVQAASKPPPHRHTANDRAAVTILGTPLSIAITPDLASALYVDGKSQFFDDFDCGTFLEVDGRVYGSKPTGSATLFTPLPFTAVSKNGPTGAGTKDDPFKIVTVVDAGETGLRLIQTVSYVNGELTYSMSFTIQNSAAIAKPIRLYYAADLFLDVPGNIPDFGVGFRDPRSGAIGAVTRDGNTVQVLLPSKSTLPDAYQESAIDGRKPFWAYIGNGNAIPGPGFNNTVDSSFHDTAAGLQWNRTIAPGASVTVKDQNGIGPNSHDVIPRGSKPAEVVVVQQASPNKVSKRDGIVTYSIVAMNHGQGNAKNVVITMPFDASKVRLLDAQFSRPEAWVSQVLPDALEIQTGSLGHNGDVVTATVRLVTLPAIPDGTALGARLSYVWYDEEGTGDGHSNLPTLVAGGQDHSEQLFDLKLSLLSNESELKYRFSAIIFAPGEPVALWYNKPDGTVKDIGTMAVGAEGEIDLDFKAEGLTPGAYSMVVYGLWTRFTAVGVFSVK